MCVRVCVCIYVTSDPKDDKFSLAFKFTKIL